MSKTITVEQTIDEQYIKSVFLNPAIYADMKDDASPANPADLLASEIMSVPGFFLSVLIDGVKSGVYWFIWRGESVEAHTALLPNCRGRDAIRATKLAIEWVFKNTAAMEIRSGAWSDAPAVKWFCRAVGLHEQETEAWPATRNGRSVNITWFNLKREEI